MQRLRYPILLFFVLLFGSCYLHRKGGERVKESKHKVKTTKELADELTAGLTNDSDKVKSIFLWIVNNVEYGGGSTDPKTIIRNKRAVCLGMSILFDSLCAEAGIEAELVLGYAYQPWYEARDTLYVDNHAWNAVKIDGEWELLDVTWSKGYWKLRKQPVKRFLMGIFHTAPAQRYRFINKPTTRYYRTDPKLFVLDHLPSDPAWQLLDCYVPIDSFQRSPYATLNYLDNPVNCKNATDSIETIVTAPEPQHMSVAARQAFAVHKRNHQDLALGASVYAGYLYQTSFDTSLSLETRMLYCDSAAAQFQNASRFFIATARDSREEMRFFLRRNRRMKAQVDGESKPLLRRHQKEIIKVRRERLQARTQIQKMRNQNRRLRQESKRIRKKEIHVRRPEVYNENQEKMVEKLTDKLDQNLELIDSLQLEMDSSAYYNFDYEGIRYDTISAQRKRLLTIMYHDMRAVLFFRQMGFTCYDTLVYSPKNEFLLVQKYHDSLRAVTRGPGKWVTDSAAKSHFGDAARIKLLLRQNMAVYAQLARLPSGTVDEPTAFRQSQEEFIRINDSLIAYNKERIKDMRRYNRSLKKLRVLHWRVKWLLRQEIRHEMYRYSAAAKGFRYHYREVFKMFRRDADASTKMKGAARKHKRELMREARIKKRNELRRQREEELRKKRELLRK